MAPFVFDSERDTVAETNRTAHQGKPLLCIIWVCLSRVSLCLRFTHKHKPTCFKEQRWHHLSLIRNAIPLSKLSGLPTKANPFCITWVCLSRVSLCLRFTHKHKPTCFQEHRVHHLSLIRKTIPLSKISGLPRLNSGKVANKARTLVTGDAARTKSRRK